MKGGSSGLIGDIMVGGLLGGWTASSVLNIGAGVSGINLDRNPSTTGRVKRQSAALREANKTADKST
jgi:hypothetical protein